MKPDSIGNCSDCQFWSEYASDKGHGLCYFFPPTVVRAGFDHATARPETFKYDWCGQWKCDPKK